MYMKFKNKFRNIWKYKKQLDLKLNLGTKGYYFIKLENINVKI